ncbi:SAM-dependent methyltransferase [Nitrosococcus wardiae]|uniref:Class I SAM-dependent methyltransferase n=1 Tax=Nitrosococcus wardiae TaxID=1814290 RepID=A0A4P7C1E6_9GAMM|nr:cyclopropane-fatty-acyl-phospholipid synthase family protein [Nitrosococcus wardiae]QBQ54636.1 class I SAM-dependent methyltransferase [Nitrosococcus wardiae]
MTTELEKFSSGEKRLEGLNRWLVARLQSAIEGLPLDITLWDGTCLRGSTEPVVAHITIHDRTTLLKILLNPELNVGEAYTTGRMDIEGDLVALHNLYNQRVASAYPTPWSRLRKRLLDLRPNTLHRARGNIYHHYDISNDFYGLWLDQYMVYTCAYFPTSAATLEEAQIAKMEHICRKLALKPGETVVEAGCGWGALSLYMAQHYGVTVRAFNISHEQISYAQEQARIAGISDRVQFIEDDYRNIAGQFDVFVSVGMLEHVGRACYPELGATIHRSLKPEGRGLLHFIGRNRPLPINAWIRRRIFPGAYPPTLQETADIFEPWNFSIIDIENLRLHYAKTLVHWLERFEEATPQIRKMFDEQFVRTWRFYLAGSQASFLSGFLQLFQVTFTRNTYNQLPWTRAHLYQAMSPGKLQKEN